jgi:hypothetical protein
LQSPRSSGAWPSATSPGTLTADDMTARHPDLFLDPANAAKHHERIITARVSPMRQRSQ